MSIKIIQEIELDDFDAWVCLTDGAIDTLKTVRKRGDIDALQSRIEEAYPDGMTDTELNALLGRDKETVFVWANVVCEECANCGLYTDLVCDGVRNNYDKCPYPER